MKNIIFTIIILCIFGCGVDVTDPQAGYFDDHTDNSVNIDNSIHYSESTKDTVIIKDTIEKKIVDTIIDTLKQIKIDTLVKHKVDTLKQTKVDTVKIVKVDTVRQTIIDTVYKKITDTVYTNTIGYSNTSFEEEPRDTTITLSWSEDGYSYSKSYDGIVYKNVFYEAKEYQYGMYAPNSNTSDYKMFFIQDNMVTVGEYNGKAGISGYNNMGTVKLTYLCGTITKPDYKDLAYSSNIEIKKFDGWRIFNEKDAYDMAKYLDKLVSDTAEIYLDLLGYDKTKGGTVTVAAAKFKVPYFQSNNRNKLKYVCAYDLK